MDRIYSEMHYYSNICFIGGAFMREFPLRDKRVIYINPVCSTADLINNALVKSAAQEYGNVRLFQ